jgi:hypothetical protein
MPIQAIYVKISKGHGLGDFLNNHKCKMIIIMANHLKLRMYLKLSFVLDI